MGVVSSHQAKPPMAPWVKNLPVMQETQETQVQFLSQEEPLEKKMATHSSILAWKTQWMGEPFGLQFIGSLVGYSPWGHKDK